MVGDKQGFCQQFSRQKSFREQSHRPIATFSWMNVSYSYSLTLHTSVVVGHCAGLEQNFILEF